MYLQSISHAIPANSFTQSDCLDILKNAPEFHALKPRSQTLLEKVLLGDNGISKRHFATEDVTSLFTLDAESLNHNFEKSAPALSSEALTRALDRAGIKACDLDALFICTCTGYLCPGLSSYVAEEMGLDQGTYLQDIVGLGCGAAIPTLRSAQGFLASNVDATVACVAVEICSAAFYLDNDPGVLISACLFGDAASATIWSNQPTPNGYTMKDFRTIHKPDARELLRFTNKKGKLRNKLHRSVPQIAGSIVRNMYDDAKINSDYAVATHVGGRDVLLALECSLPSVDLTPSWEMLNQYGNTSSPSVLLVAEDMLSQQEEPDSIWLTSFGAGFAAHACKLERLA